MKRIFSEEDEEYLAYYFYCGEKSLDAAAEFLGLTNEKLYRKASKMRAKGQNVDYIYRPFTEKEIKYIKKNYRNIPTDLMADHLKRTREVIIYKANQLGLSKLDRVRDYDKKIRILADKGYTRAQIARELHLKPKSVGDYINRNHIKCRKANRSEMGGYFRELEQARNNEMKQKYHYKR